MEKSERNHLAQTALGKDLQVTKLCLGSLTVSPMQAALPIERAAAVMAYAFDRGINFTDTAQYYENYHILRAALKRCKAPEKVVISTKTYAWSRELAEAAVEEARRALDRDVIDIFMLHEQESVDTLRGHMEALEYLFECKSRGIIRAVGASMHHIAAVEGVITLTERGIPFDVIHPIFNKKGIGIADGEIEEMEKAVKKAHDLGIGTFAMKSLGGGHLYSSAEEAFDFVLSKDYIDSVAVGMQSEAEIDANISYFENGIFPPEAKKVLDGKKRTLLIEDYCEGCGSCIERCTQNALRLEEGRAKVNMNKCVLCGYCSKACPMFAIKVI
ncbi:MAG: aldo/keto reductase [Ruminococcaceae bacterium]|nr:aldo/keto reductase [Oscillospiraceae bacterium]